MTFVTIGLYDLKRSADAVMLHGFNGTYYKMPVLFFFFFVFFFETIKKCNHTEASSAFVLC